MTYNIRIKPFYTGIRYITLLLPMLRPLNGIPTSNHQELNSLSVQGGGESLPYLIKEELITAEIGTRLLAIVVLVILGGIFAGLTIGLMGLDETNLQVLVVAGEPDERKHAQKVLQLMQRGKHWVLVTLLLSNVIVNETLPIIMDSVYGGGWLAIMLSTALIVLFGEIIPQAICVRHGLGIGAGCSWFVLCLMYIMYPIAHPIADLLDYFLGEHHGTMYRKSELKTFVSLHKNGGIESLNEDEVTIIGAVLELREKPVSSIMTPIADVYTLSADHILDQKTINEISTAGYSRIPIYERPHPTNFIGILLVKKLISYDPEDALPVRDFALGSLPETSPDTSCLDILNFFQEGRSHMVLVSDDPGGEGGALGVLTLEDVIEELIGEEIIDETDVYVDVHNKVKVVRRPPRHIRPRPYPMFTKHRTSSHLVGHPNHTLVQRTSNDGLGKQNLTIHSDNESTDSLNYLKPSETKDDRRAKSAKLFIKLSPSNEGYDKKNGRSEDTSQVADTSMLNKNYGSTEESKSIVNPTSTIRHSKNLDMNESKKHKGKRLPDHEDNYQRGAVAKKMEEELLLKKS
ncbi:hypothetical protein G9A89_011099 [Geosiphon pyriformis]|nr:hypothetical protein G9A89_011099 [Geosiphon pyriformis]